MALDPAGIALFSTVAGTIGLKVVDHTLTKGRVRIDDAANIRDELREEIKSNKEDIARLEAEVDRWRKEYYDLRDKYVQIQTELTIALRELKEKKGLDTDDSS